MSIFNHLHLLILVPVTTFSVLDNHKSLSVHLPCFLLSSEYGDQSDLIKIKRSRAPEFSRMVLVSCVAVHDQPPVVRLCHMTFVLTHLD